MFTNGNDLTRIIIGSAIEVHRTLGPGLLESVYHRCLARELELQRVPFKYEWPLPLEYKGLKFKKGYQMDLLVDDQVIVEVKSLINIAPVHEAQLLTYMRLRRVRLGLLLNFNEVVLKDGIRRKILDFD
jgi:GxxExxY protein